MPDSSTSCRLRSLEQTMKIASFFILLLYEPRSIQYPATATVCSLGLREMWSVDFRQQIVMTNLSNAADKYAATQIVRSGGFLWLNPIALSVVNCSRAVLVEWSCLNRVVLEHGAGWIYLLIVDRIRDSRTFAAGQRIEIGRYEVPMEVSLPGFSIGMINEDFHIARIWDVVTERLKNAMMRSIALGLRCFKWKMLILSGPNALLFLDCSHHLIRGEYMCHLQGFPLCLSFY